MTRAARAEDRAILSHSESRYVAVGTLRGVRTMLYQGDDLKRAQGRVHSQSDGLVYERLGDGDWREVE